MTTPTGQRRLGDRYELGDVHLPWRHGRGALAGTYGLADPSRSRRCEPISPATQLQARLSPRGAVGRVAESSGGRRGVRHR